MGNIIVMVIKCANGETITLIHGISLPRPDSRNGRVQGKGSIWLVNIRGLFIEGLSKIPMEIDVAGNPFEVHEWNLGEKYHGEYNHSL